MAQYKLGAPRSNRKTFFDLPPYLAERSCKNPLSARDPARCKSGPAITWLISVAIYCTIFNNISVIHLHLPSFYAQNTLKKLALKNADFINFNRGPGPPGRICTPITGYFHDKTKIFKENLRVDYYSLLKCSQRQSTSLLPTWTKSLTIKIYFESARC